MNEISCSSWLRFLLFFSSLSLQFISGSSSLSSHFNFILYMCVGGGYIIVFVYMYMLSEIVVIDQAG